MSDETVNELKMFQVAQEITDKYFGAGAYVKLNHFDPSKGETHRVYQIDNKGYSLSEIYDALQSRDYPEDE